MPVAKANGSKKWFADYVCVPETFLDSLPIVFAQDRVEFTFENGFRNRRFVSSKAWRWQRSNGADTPQLWPELVEKLRSEVWITEGESDCIVARYAGFEAYTLTCGAVKAVDAATLKEMKRRGAQRIVLALDADDAGQSAIPKHVDALRGAGLEGWKCDLSQVVHDDEKDLRDVWVRMQCDVEAFSHTLSDAVTEVEQPDNRVPAINSTEEWPEPQPIMSNESRVPTLSSELIPDQLRKWCTDVAECMAVPLDYTGVAALVSLSSMVGRRVMILPKRRDDWCVVPNLWGAIIGPPGVMKTSALNEVRKVLQELEAEAYEENRVKLEQYDWAISRFEARKKGIEKELQKPSANEATLRRELESLKPEKPPMIRHVVNDATVEKLGEILRDNPTGLLLFRDELSGFLTTFDRPGREGDRQFYLEAWDGDGTFTTDRINRGTVRVEHTCVSILGGIQPGPFRLYVNDACAGGNRADGLLQRFQLLVWPDLQPDYEHVDREPDTDARCTAYDLFAEFVQISEGTVQKRFHEESQAVFDEWYIDLEQRLRSGGEPDAFVGHLSKYRSLVPSIALLWDLAGDAGPAVGCEAVKAAIRWAEYLEAHARRVYAIADTNTNAADALAQKIKSGELSDGFSEADIRRNHWSGLSTLEAVRDAVGLLSDADWIQGYIPERDKPERDKPERDKPGRVTTRYRVNPKVRK